MIYYFLTIEEILEENIAINVNISKLDELILLIRNSVDEKQKRILLNKVTEAHGRCRVTLYSRNVEAIRKDGIMPNGRIRREGAGHKSFTEHHVEFEISVADMDVLKQVERIKDYGEHGFFPVFGGKMKSLSTGSMYLLPICSTIGIRTEKSSS